MRDLVKWPELAPYFAKAYPRIIQDALDNQKRVQIDFKGVWFFVQAKTRCTCHLITRRACFACQEQTRKERTAPHELIEVFGPACYKQEEGFVN